MTYSNEIAVVKAELNKLETKKLELELNLIHLEKMQAIADKLELEKMTKKEKLVRLTIKGAAKLLGRKVEFKSESKGTVRFSLTNKTGKAKQGLYRIRKRDSRALELQTGDSFNQLHYGKVTIGLERNFGRDLFQFAINAK